MTKYVAGFMKKVRDMDAMNFPKKTVNKAFLDGLTNFVKFRDRVSDRIAREVDSLAVIELTRCIDLMFDEVDVYERSYSYMSAGSEVKTSHVGTANSSAGSSNISKNAKFQPTPTKSVSAEKKKSPLPPTFVYDPKSKPCCFNCGGDHNVKECGYKRNEDVIAANVAARKEASKTKASVVSIAASGCPPCVFLCDVGDQKARVLFDSGADRPLISPSFLSSLAPSAIRSRAAAKLSLCVADGRHVEVTERVEINLGVSVKGTLISVPLKPFVLPIMYDVIVDRETAVKHGFLSIHVDRSTRCELLAPVDTVMSAQVTEGERVPNICFKSSLPSLPVHSAAAKIVSTSVEDIVDDILCDESDLAPMESTSIQKPDWMPAVVNVDRKEDFVAMLLPYRELFEEQFPGATFGLPEFRIQLKPDASLPRLAPRRLSPALEEIARTEVTELEALGVIRKSVSSVASPIVMVLYPSGKRRLCVDYRLLNEATVPMMYPMRNVKALIARVGKKKCFAKLDLFKGYHQLRVAEDTIPLLAFCVPWGLYEYTRMPFGPRNGPAVFQQVMDVVLSDLLYVCCESFVDDILVYGDSVDELLVNCGQVMDRLLAAGLRCRATKSEFGSTSIQYLGYVISSEGISMSPERIQTIMSISAPTNRKALRSFNGMINYFHDFIPHFATDCKPLFEEGSGQQPFCWTEKLQSVFDGVKEKLKQCTMLNFVDYKYPILLRTDASNAGVGGVLLQIIDGQENYILFVSKAFNSVQARWATIEQEAFAVYFGILAVSHHVLGHHFTVETDHRNLMYLDKATAPKLIRWRIRLQEFDFNVVHVPGTSNVIADVLSRVHHAEGTTSCVNAVSDELLELVNDSKFNDVIAHFHNSTVGHRGANTTVRLMTDSGISFPDIRNLVMKFIARCSTCQKLAPIGAGAAGPSRPISATEPFQCLALDTVGPLPEDYNGNKYIIVCVDSFSRFVDLFPSLDTTASSAVGVLMSIFGRYGLPQRILTDNGSQYSNHLMNQLLKSVNVPHSFSVPYRSEGNGIVERVNKEVMRHLRAIIFDERVESEWSRLLPRVQYLINSTVHSSLGVSPLTLLFGSNVSTNRGLSFSGFADASDSTVHESLVNLYRNEVDICDAARRHQESIEAVRMSKLNHDKFVAFTTGELVLVAPPSRPASKIAVVWKGPYVVLECRSRSYRVRSLIANAKPSWVDVSRLKSYVVGDNTLDHDQVLLRDVQEYEVEAIVDHRPIDAGYKGKSKQKFIYVVKWTGYSDEDNTDASYASIKDVDVFKAYCKTHSLQ